MCRTPSTRSRFAIARQEATPTASRLRERARVSPGRQLQPVPDHRLLRLRLRSVCPQPCAAAACATGPGTLFVNLLGNHAFKLGFDFEDNLSDNTRKYTGTDFDPNSLYPVA